MAEAEIRDVSVSSDGGKNWTAAKLREDLGNFSFRGWQIWLELAAGERELQVRATGNDGKVQPMQALWNPAGYLRNVVETTRVTVA
jgi:sulfite dehydrogenase